MGRFHCPGHATFRVCLRTGGFRERPVYADFKDHHWTAPGEWEDRAMRSHDVFGRKVFAAGPAPSARAKPKPAATPQAVRAMLERLPPVDEEDLRGFSPRQAAEAVDDGNDMLEELRRDLGIQVVHVRNVAEREAQGGYAPKLTIENRHEPGRDQARGGGPPRPAH